jgi:glycerophosphoryl diester phosphodiesterase
MWTRREIVWTALSAAACGARRVDAIAHRGEHRECPENTLPAIEKAIALGCDWVEIDVRSTRDGKFVLMHNRTVEATTDGQGPVAERTFAEIRRLDAGARRPGYAGTRVPSLDEALEVMRGKCGVYLDAKEISAPAIVAAVERHGMLDRCVVYGSFDLLRALAAMGHARLAMPEAVSVETLRRSLAEIQPRVVAFDRHDFREDVVAAARQAGVGMFVDRLGPEDTEAHWADAIRRGATGIQSDRPAELVRFLAGAKRG